MKLFTAPIRTFLLCFLILVPFLAVSVPVQSQATPTAGPCGLPANRQSWTSSTTQTTWSMTTNCTFSTSNTYYIRIPSGTFTVNGNGHTIYSDSDATAFQIEGTSSTLNLNNVTIRGLNASLRSLISVAGRLNATDVTLRNNRGNATVNVSGRADLTNIRIQNNTAGTSGITSSAIAVGNGSTVNLQNAIITGNSGSNYVVGVYGSGRINITGCLTMSGNSGTNLASHSGGAGTPVINNNNTGACPSGGFLSAANMTATAEANMTATAEANMTATAEAELTATAEANMTATAEAMTPGPVMPPDPVMPDPVMPDPVAPPAPSGPRTSKKKKDPPRPTPTATPRPAYAASYVALQTETGMTFEATYGLESGVHFRQLDGGGIGVQSIIDAGPLAALDVYGYVEQGVEVCFPQIGRVIFLDARTMPRAIIALEATVRDGMTCVSINSPGSLVLLPS